MPYATKVTEDIRRLEEIINSEYLLHMVPTLQDKKALVANCYNNVARRMKELGGTIQYGWVLIDNDFFCEAEHHAVWESKAGGLWDITPRFQNLNEILFIPDDRIAYEGKNIDNVRLNKTGCVVVGHFLAISEHLNRILGTGVRTGDYNVQLMEKEGSLFQKYNALKFDIWNFLIEGKNSGSNCFCGSEQSYLMCHGRSIISEIESESKSLHSNTVIFREIISLAD